MSTDKEPSFSLKTFRGKCSDNCPACDNSYSGRVAQRRAPIRLPCKHIFCVQCLEVAFLNQITTAPKGRCHCLECNRTVYEHLTNPHLVTGLNAKLVGKTRSMDVFVLVDTSIEYGAQMQPNPQPAPASPYLLPPGQRLLPNGDPWPSKDDVFYATTRYLLEVDVHGGPITAQPWWFPFVCNSNQGGTP